MARLKLFLFGAPEILLDDEPVHIVRRKAMGMLIFLVVSEQPQSRDTLGAMFWPESSDSRKQVRIALSALRSVLGSGWLTEYSEVVRIANAADIWVDLLAFRTTSKPGDGSLTQTIEQLEQAMELVRGNLLAGFSLRDCPMFDSWLMQEEYNVDHIVDQTLRQLVHLHDTVGDRSRAIHFAERLIANDDLKESSYQLLMRLNLKHNQPHDVLRVYERCVEILQIELSLKPTPETEAILKQALAERSSDGATQAVYPIPDSVVPYHQHAFLGRDDELALVFEKLANPTCRLVSLVGIGGIGKTHLASKIVEDALDILAIKPYFISLEGVDDPGQALLVLAAQIQTQLLPGVPVLDQLTASLKNESALIVLSYWPNEISEVQWTA